MNKINGEISGKNVVCLYPDFKMAFLSRYDDGVFIQGRACKVKSFHRWQKKLFHLKWQKDFLTPKMMKKIFESKVRQKCLLLKVTKKFVASKVTGIFVASKVAQKFLLSEVTWQFLVSKVTTKIIGPQEKNKFPASKLIWEKLCPNWCKI